MLPRRRKPSPTGKVDRAQPGPDEGKQPKSEKQAPLNGSNLHPMWPVSLFGCGPLIRHALRRATFPVGEGDLPAGALYPLLGEGGRAKPGRVWGGTEHTARRSLSQPGADSSLYAREPAPHPPLRRHLPPGEGQELLLPNGVENDAFPVVACQIPDPGPVLPGGLCGRRVQGPAQEAVARVLEAV